MTRGLTAQIRALFEEFPFVKRYLVNVNWLNGKPSIQRVDLELIDRWAWTGSWSAQNDDCRIDSHHYYLIDHSGNELAQVKPYNACEKRWFQKRKIITGETVAEAIDKLEDPNNISCILEITDRYGREDPRNSRLDSTMWGLNVTIHKVPTGRTFRQWMEEIPLIAQEQLKKELDAIDKV